MGLYTKGAVIRKMYTCEYLHVNKEVLTVSAPEGTDICEFPQDGFVYKSFYDLKTVYL